MPCFSSLKNLIFLNNGFWFGLGFFAFSCYCIDSLLALKKPPQQTAHWSSDYTVPLSTFWALKQHFCSPSPSLLESRGQQHGAAAWSSEMLVVPMRPLPLLRWAHQEPNPVQCICLGHTVGFGGVFTLLCYCSSILPCNGSSNAGESCCSHPLLSSWGST